MGMTKLLVKGEELLFLFNYFILLYLSLEQHAFHLPSLYETVCGPQFFKLQCQSCGRTTPLCKKCDGATHADEVGDYNKMYQSIIVVLQWRLI